MFQRGKAAVQKEQQISRYRGGGSCLGLQHNQIKLIVNLLLAIREGCSDSAAVWGFVVVQGFFCMELGLQRKPA